MQNSSYTQKRNPQNRQNSQNTAPQINLPEIILDYTKDENLFDTTAKKVADEIKTSQNQMRNFYDYVLKLCDRVEKNDFSEILPFVKMLNSKVAYARARNTIGDGFKAMIEKCVPQVGDEKTLKCFKLFFEAVLGFSKRK